MVLASRVIEVLDNRSDNLMTELRPLRQALEFAKINQVTRNYLKSGVLTEWSTASTIMG